MFAYDDHVIFPRLIMTERNNHSIHFVSDDL